MSTALAVYERFPDPLAAINQLGEAIARSQMFGCDKVEQGVVLAMECMARGVPPMMLAEDYHIIEGKLSMRADAMLARFNELGGTHKIVERTADAAEIELTIHGNTHRERFTWEEAQQEPTPFAKDKKTLKKNWATPRARRQMLWARVVSEGIRPLCPTVNRGRYTPEELDASEETADTNGAVVDAEFTTVPEPYVPPAAEQATEPATVVEPTEEPTVAAAVADSDPVKPAVAPAGNDCTAEQQSRIKELWGLLNVAPADREKQLTKRGVNSLRSLTASQAAELITALEGVLAKRKAAQVADLEPCTAEQAAAVRAKLQECNQKQGGLVAAFKEKMARAKVAKIDDLTSGEANGLLEALSGGDFASFIGGSLWKPLDRADEGSVIPF